MKRRTGSDRIIMLPSRFGREGNSVKKSRPLPARLTTNMQFILFDDQARNHLLPFTHIRPVADIRCGILTMRERWEYFLGKNTATATVDYLQPAFPPHLQDDNIFINSSAWADHSLIQAIYALNTKEVLLAENKIIAFRTALYNRNIEETVKGFSEVEYPNPVIRLERLPDLFLLNEQSVISDFDLLTKDQNTQPLPDYVTAIAPENIFVAAGAKVGPCILNAENGPIYIGADAEIMEGALIRGPFALCSKATVKMGAKIYGGTTIGPGCKVGGEISNTLFFGNSNKGHDGFLGNSVVGEWCNFGADTNCSNLKNNYDEVKIWSETENELVPTGQQFCGLFMGDHSKCGINTMFNTGTVVGISCNIFGGDFPPKFIPSFSWGGSSGLTTFKLEKAMETAGKMMERRGKKLSGTDREIWKHIQEHTAYQRKDY